MIFTRGGGIKYAGSMLGFSWKRFLITLGLSIGVWLVSGFIQALTNKGEFGSYVFGVSCELTGYPIALCVSSNDKIRFSLVVIANVMLWFWVLHFVWSFFQKRSK